MMTYSEKMFKNTWFLKKRRTVMKLSNELLLSRDEN